MTMPTIDEFSASARAWLEENAELRERGTTAFTWGEGDFSTAVFHNLSFDEELAHLQKLHDWQALRVERGYHAIDWPVEYGGLGLDHTYTQAYRKIEADFVTPERHELFSVTVGLIAPTVNVFGTEQQKKKWIPELLRTDYWSCQLFSEPGAGSDLATLGCKAVRDGDEWVITGQKVWTSGAQFSHSGLLLARTNPDVPKHKGITAFIVPFDAEGVEIRQIKQMSGGTSFNEVFYTEARFPDECRIGEVGEGWKVALTTLGFERNSSGSGNSKPGGTWAQVRETAQALGVSNDPVIRDEMMRLYCHNQAERLLKMRASELAKAGTPGPEGSLGKIMWTNGMTMMSDVVSKILGPRLIADTGEWGTYEWGEHVLGAPGYRIAGGSDEVQRNIIGERVLGLPREPRTDKDMSWREIPK